MLKKKQTAVRFAAFSLVGCSVLAAGGAAGLAVAGAATHAKEESAIDRPGEENQLDDWGSEGWTDVGMGLAFGGATVATLAGAVGMGVTHVLVKNALKKYNVAKEAQTKNFSQVILEKGWALMRVNGEETNLDETKKTDEGIAWFLCEKDGSIEIVGGDKKSTSVKIASDGKVKIVAGKSVIDITKDGNVRIDSETRLLLTGKTGVGLLDEKQIQLNAPDVYAKNGKFETKNFVDTGG